MAGGNDGVKRLLETLKSASNWPIHPVWLFEVKLAGETSGTERPSGRIGGEQSDCRIVGGEKEACYGVAAYLVVSEFWTDLEAVSGRGSQ